MMDESDEPEEYTPLFERVEEAGDRSLGFDGSRLDWENLGDALADLIVLLVAAWLYEDFDESGQAHMWLAVEYLEQAELLDDGHHKPVIVRQASFIEYLLIARIEQRWREEKGEDLSNSERDFVRNKAGLQTRLYMASMLGILEADEEQALQELFSARNTLGHTPWIALADDREEQLERLANRIHDYLEELAEDDRLHNAAESILDQLSN